MYSAVEITNFRGFDHLRVEHLARVNLVLGDNGVGKTSLLEALFLLAARGNPELALRLNAWRDFAVAAGADALDAFLPLFRDFDAAGAVVLDGQQEDGRTRLTIELAAADRTEIPLPSLDGNGGGRPVTSLPGDMALKMTWGAPGRPDVVRVGRFEERVAGPAVELSFRIEPAYISDGPISVFVSPNLPFGGQQGGKRFTQVRQEGKAADMIEFMQSVDSRISDLELLSVGGETVLHADIGLRRMVPLGFVGDGALRAASLYLSASTARGGLLLVDEVGTGIHYTALREGFWQGVRRVAGEFDVQVFATTHSWECIAAAQEAFEAEPPEDFMVHRLERVGGEIRCKSFDAEALGGAMELGFEVR